MAAASFFVLKSKKDIAESPTVRERPKTNTYAYIFVIESDRVWRLADLIISALPCILTEIFA